MVQAEIKNVKVDSTRFQSLGISASVFTLYSVLFFSSIKAFFGFVAKCI